MPEMDQNCEQGNFGETTGIQVPMKETCGREKCNQCDNATHLKIHCGEKPNKCNECDFASSQAGDLRRHLKTHCGE